MRGSLKPERESHRNSGVGSRAYKDRGDDDRGSCCAIESVDNDTHVAADE